ncbi:MAG: YeiH family protein [Turicibacter sp.]|nr:YeiH family protein [Turicibacter sp.]
MKMKDTLINFKEILPGLIICIIIGLVSKFVGDKFPTLGPAPIAIAAGLLLGNTVLTQKTLHKGVRFSESNLLSYSIVLLGGTLSYTVILELGLKGVSFIVLQMVLTILFCIFVGKKLGFSEDFRLLMASGNAVCGSSAIGATAPVVKANDVDKSITITLVNLTGTILMMILPSLTNLLYHNETMKSSAVIGGILQSVGQVVGSALMVNHEVEQQAMIFKIVRIIFLVFIILAFAELKKEEENHEAELHHQKPKSKIKIPWYVIGFFIMCLLFSIGIFNDNISHGFKQISSYLEIFALAGIGMSVKFKDLMKAGLKSGIYCLSIGIAQILFAIILIAILHL